VETDVRRQPDWLIRPLLDAGMGVEEIRSLVLRLGVEAIIPSRSGTAACLTRLVSDQPTAVQAAWAEMIGRMIELGGRAEASPC
jgi:hypothetical protein